VGAAPPASCAAAARAASRIATQRGTRVFGESGGDASGEGGGLDRRRAGRDDAGAGAGGGPTGVVEIVSGGNSRSVPPKGSSETRAARLWGGAGRLGWALALGLPGPGSVSARVDASAAGGSALGRAGGSAVGGGGVSAFGGVSVWACVGAGASPSGCMPGMAGGAPSGTSAAAARAVARRVARAVTDGASGGAPTSGVNTGVNMLGSISNRLRRRGGGSLVAAAMRARVSASSPGER
jgi:hypothetical protein